MALLVFAIGLGALCILVWTIAVYAVPAFVAFAVAFWCISHGAGIVSVPLGLLAGVAILLVARIALSIGNRALCWLTLALYVLPAAYAGYCISLQLLNIDGATQPIWRTAAALFAAVAVGAAAFRKLATAPSASPYSNDG